MIQNSPEMNVSRRVDVLQKKPHQKNQNSREDISIFVGRNADLRLNRWCETFFKTMSSQRTPFLRKCGLHSDYSITPRSLLLPRRVGCRDGLGWKLLREHAVSGHGQ